MSDRDTTFTGQYFTDLYEFLGIKRSMSTAYHPESDGQTEHINQVIEAYLRSYCNYEQNDWSEMLPIAEYAYNSSKLSATKISPFYANYRFEPRTNWPTEIQFRNPASEMYGHYMNGVHTTMKQRLEASIEAMGKYYNKKRKTISPIQKGELFMLNAKNIRTKHWCRRLEYKMLGPFEVLSVGKNLRYCKLKLPEQWKIHPGFNISLLERYRGEKKEAPEVEVEADGDEWVMEYIIATGHSNDNAKKHIYLVKWKDFTHEENTWESYENVMDHDEGLLEEFYAKNGSIERDGRFKAKTKKKRKQRY